MCLKPVAGEFLALAVPGLSEGRPSVLVGDRVILREPFMPEDSPEYEGYVHEVRRDEVWLKFVDSFHSSYNGQDYNARFTFNRTTLRRCHQAAEFAPQLGEQGIIAIIVFVLLCCNVGWCLNSFVFYFMKFCVLAMLSFTVNSSKCNFTNFNTQYIGIFKCSTFVLSERLRNYENNCPFASQ